MHLSDTVLLNEDNKVENFTKTIGIEFEDIGYDISEDPKNDYALPNTKPYVDLNAPRMTRAQIRREKI